jgi:hypothetical protein
MLRVVITIPKLEMHVADACNLRCSGCNHYANLRLKGTLAFADGSPWLRAWSRRVAPVHFSFLGGEPLLNPDLPEYLRLARALWPHARLRLVSNGLLLDRRPDLWPALALTRATLTISIHSDEPAYRRRLEPQLARAEAEAVARGVRIERRNCIDEWYRPYRGAGESMRPFADGDPAASWRACNARHCVTLRDNALWKCPPVAHLPRVAEKYGLAEDTDAWALPLAYRPLTLSATDDDLRRFIARGPEAVCGMCPARPEFFVKSVFGERPQVGEPSLVGAGPDRTRDGDGLGEVRLPVTHRQGRVDERPQPR